MVRSHTRLRKYSCSSTKSWSDTCNAFILKQGYIPDIQVGFVVYHVTIVASGHGLLEEVLTFGNKLRSSHCRNVLSDYFPITLLELHNYFSSLAIYSLHINVYKKMTHAESGAFYDIRLPSDDLIKAVLEIYKASVASLRDEANSRLKTAPFIACFRA